MHYICIEVHAGIVQRSDGVPPGLATSNDGGVDESYYTQTQGFHPDFVKELRSAMQEEAKTHPKPAKDDSWQKCIATVQPLVEEEQARLVKQLEEVRTKEKCALSDTPSTSGHLRAHSQ